MQLINIRIDKKRKKHKMFLSGRMKGCKRKRTHANYDMSNTVKSIGVLLEMTDIYCTASFYWLFLN